MPTFEKLHPFGWSFFVWSDRNGAFSDACAYPDETRCSASSLFSISYVLNTVRSFCLGSRSRFLKGKIMCAALCVMQVAALIFTWDGWWSILPVAANIAATVGGYTYDPRKIRIVGMLVNSPLWIIYDIIIGSWAGILDEIVTEASMIVSIFRYGWKNLDDVGD